MARLVLLGTGAALPNAQHENTYMLLDGPHAAILNDCAGNPIGRLEHAGVALDRLESVIITHIHPDHTYGLPSLLMGMWLAGRTRPLHIYALGSVAKRLQAILENFEWGEWPGFYAVTFHAIDDAPGAHVIDNADFRIDAWRTKHMVPTIGLRIENKTNGYVTAYSCDTEPCANVLELAQGADLLIHEAAGATPGHSSAAQAGEAGRVSGARKLALIHYLVPADLQALAREAQSTFGAPVDVTQDFDEYSV